MHQWSVVSIAGTFRADQLAKLATFERRSVGPGSKGPATTTALVATASPAFPAHPPLGQ